MKTEPMMPNALREYEEQRKMRRTERSLIAAGLCGVAVATAALLWPVPAAPPRISAAPIVVPLEAPAANADRVDGGSAAAPTEPVEGAAIEIQASRPIIPIAHEDQETDFLTLADEQIDDGDLRSAFESLRKHLYNHEPKAQVLLKIGRLGFELRELAIAEQALLDAGALAPEDADIAIERGRVLLEGGDLKDARAAARQAIRIDKENPSAWNLAGRVAMAESNWERSESSFQKAVELDPTDPMIHNNLGLLYVMMKKPALAVDALEASAELYGDDVPYFVHNNLGLAYEAAGRLEDAQEAFESAAVANPDYARAQVNLRRVLKTLAMRVETEARERRTAGLDPSETSPSPSPSSSPSPSPSDSVSSEAPDELLME